MAWCITLLRLSGNGGRKFRIGRHRKNRERKKVKKVIVEDQPLDELKVSLYL